MTKPDFFFFIFSHTIKLRMKPTGRNYTPSYKSKLPLIPRVTQLAATQTNPIPKLYMNSVDNHQN